MVRLVSVARVANRLAIDQSSAGRARGWKPQISATLEMRLASIDTNQLQCRRCLRSGGTGSMNTPREALMTVDLHSNQEEVA